MCTIMTYPETLPAEKLSKANSQKMVDQLMDFDHLLSQPFTRDDLQELFQKQESRFSFCSCKGEYSILTDAEKELLAELDLVPEDKEKDNLLYSITAGIEKLSLADRRRKMKSRCVDTPQFKEYTRAIPGGGGFWYTKSCNSGRINVWLDNATFGNSDQVGFYYVRWQKSIFSCGSTAYDHPVLIVQKNKLRPDQIEYMERKCKETRES